MWRTDLHRGPLAIFRISMGNVRGPERRAGQDFLFLGTASRLSGVKGIYSLCHRSV